MSLCSKPNIVIYLLGFKLMKPVGHRPGNEENISLHVQGRE